MYSLFHTSYCGSTLLSCLLSKSIVTYAEPDWSHNLLNMQTIEEKIESVEKNYIDNTLVKYSSKVTDIMPFLKGKKVFLYKDFEDHLRKLAEVSFNFNPQIEAIEWSKRFINACLSKNCIYIQSDYFIKNQQEACQKICDFFEIEYKPLSKEIGFHVKKTGFNNNNNFIDPKLFE
jgi:hypothetical protein